MLLYLGKGKRWYAEKPLEIQKRRGWEFQAVLRGKIAPTLHDGKGRLESSHMWIFPPEHPHGWTGLPGKHADIAVFHFISAPELIQHMVGKKGFLEIKLDQTMIARIKELHRKVEHYWSHPAPGMMICFELALMELSLMVCESNTSNACAPAKSFAHERVEKALVWFSQRIGENPSLTQMAEAISVSPAHLRRLFQLVLQTSPKQIMDQQRFQHAMLLMSDPNMKFEEISERCGFNSASAFSRAFKIKFGCSPDEWRGRANR